MWRGWALTLLGVKGVELANKDGMFGKSDPYLKFIAIQMPPPNEVVHWQRRFEDVHRTETIPNDLNPVWKPFVVDMGELCNGDLDAEFKLECWDEDSMKSDDMIGWIDTTVSQLFSKQPLVLNDRPGGKTAKPGSLAIDNIHLSRTPSFLDYITGGCELTVTMAVDFTASNGLPVQHGCVCVQGDCFWGRAVCPHLACSFGWWCLDSHLHAPAPCRRSSGPQVAACNGEPKERSSGVPANIF